MNRREFIDEVFTFFKCKDEDLKRSYDLAFTVKDAINWSKLYQIVINEAETRYLPAPKWFKDFFSRCVVYDGGATNDGIKIRVFVKHRNLPDGYPYYYETFNNSASLEKLKQNKIKEFGSKFIQMQVFNEDELVWEKV